ncbi:MAG: acyl-CoA dehydrogenase family protein [Polyangiales bacterium]
MTAPSPPGPSISSVVARRGPALSVDDLGFVFAAHHASLARTVRAAVARVAALESPLESEAGHAVDARDRAIVRALGDGGLLRLFAPEGDARLDLRGICLVREGLAWESGNADSLFAVQGLGTHPIGAYGTDAQQRALIAPALSGAAVGAFALTEPEAGTDVGSLRTTATLQGGRWTLDGDKVFISNAPIADRFVLFANADPSKGRKGITAFVVPRDAPGLTVEGPTPLVAAHSIGTVRLRGCTVDDGARLGAVGQGFSIAMATLDTFRVSVGAAACGMARRALDEALHRAATRQQFGGAIGEFQQIQAYLAQSQAELDAARLLVFRAARLRDDGAASITREAAIAKMYATEVAQTIIDRAVQIHGGMGVVRGVAVERLYREVRALRIYEGTTEIQRVVIAKGMLHDERARLSSAPQDR